MAEEAKLVVTLQDQASASAQKVAKEIAGIGQAAAQSARQQADIIQSSGSLGQQLERLTRQAQTLLTGGLIGGAVMFAANQIQSWATAVSDAAKEGEGLTKTAVALERDLYRAGLSADVFRQSLRDATSGEMSGAALEMLAKKVKDVGLEWSQIPGFLAAAKSAADIRGENVAETTEKLGRALAMGSSKTLAQYDILIDKTTVLAEAARAAGVPVAALTEEQERQALITAGLAQLTGQTADAVSGMGSAADRMSAAWADAMNRVKQSIGGGRPEWLDWLGAPPPVGDWEATAADVAAKIEKLREVRRQAGQQQDGVDIFGNAVMGEEGVARYLEQAAVIAGAEKELSDVLAGSLRSLGADAQATAEQMRGMNLAQMAGSDATAQWLATLEQQEVELRKNALGARELAESLGLVALGRAADDSEKMADALEQQRIKLANLDAAYRATPEQIREWRDELVKLQVEGKGASDQAKELESWVGAAKSATAAIDGMVEKLAGVVKLGGSLGQAQSLLPDGTQAQVLAVANALDQVAEAQRRLDEARKRSDIAAQQAALAALNTGLSAYTHALQEAGVNADVLAKAQEQAATTAALMGAAVEQAAARTVPGMKGLAQNAASLTNGLFQLLDPAKAFANATELYDWLKRNDVAAAKTAKSVEKVKTELEKLLESIGDVKPLEGTDLVEQWRQEAETGLVMSADQIGAAYAKTFTGIEFDSRTWGQRASDNLRLLGEQAVAQSAQWGQMMAAAWSQAGSGIQAAMSITGQQMTQYWSTTMTAIGDLTSGAVGAVGAALAKDWDVFGSAMTAGLSALTPIIANLTNSARAAAGIIGGIALAAAAVFGLTGFGWAVAGPLAALGASLIAYSLVPQKKTGAAQAAAPSVRSAAVASSGSSGATTIVLNQYYSGGPIVTGEQIADFTSRGLRGMVGLGITAPREVIPA